MATLLRTDGSRALVHPAGGRDRFTVEELQGYVDGPIDIVPVPGGYLVVHDEGLLIGLPSNTIASHLYGGYIAGDAVWCHRGEVD